MAKTAKKSKLNWRTIAGVIVALVAAFFVILQWDSILKSLESLKDADSRYIFLALLTFSATVLAAAGVVYNLRIVVKDKYLPILTVQTAGLFLGRITPASIGGIAAMIRLLVTQGHSVVQASSVMGAAAISTFVGNMLISSVALLFAINQVDFSAIKIPTFMLIMTAVIILIATSLLFISRVRERVTKVLKEIAETMRQYKKRKLSIVKAIALGAFLTLMYATTMMLVAYSLGVELTMFAAIITVSLGSLGVAVTPLPGGAIGAEAAIAATLVQFGVSSELALAIAFVYRAITFWIPLLPGFIASQYSLKKEYL